MIVPLLETGVAPRILRISPFEGIAPFRFCWIVVGVVAVAAGAIGHRFRQVAGCGQELLELADRYFVPPQVKRSGDADPMHGRLVVETPGNGRARTADRPWRVLRATRRSPS